MGLYKTSTESPVDMNRRTFLRTAGGAAGGAAAASAGAAPATAASEEGGGGGEKPDFGGYLDDANNYDGSVTDARGQDEVTVDVGAGSSGLAFGPAAVHVDNGATVVWEWTGEGGAHNVIAEDGSFESGSPVSSGTFEHTFDEDGLYEYFCSPHKGQGMKGVVIVGTEFPTVQTGGDVGPSDLPSSAKTLGVATMVVMAGTLGLSYFFMKYGGDYGEFEE